MRLVQVLPQAGLMARLVDFGDAVGVVWGGSDPCGSGPFPASQVKTSPRP